MDGDTLECRPKFSKPRVVQAEQKPKQTTNNRKTKNTMKFIPKFLLVAFSSLSIVSADYVSDITTVTGGTFGNGTSFNGQSVSTFKIGTKEITWADWQTVRTYAVANGFDIGTSGSGSGATNPAETISWYDAIKWCNAASLLNGKTPVYTVNGTTYKTGEVIPSVNTSANGYRLPSEKEWEWAAIGGASTHGYIYSGSNTANTVCWSRDNTPTSSQPVGTKAANELSIYDMSGNVFEWCFDDVTGVVGRRIRGGGWTVNADSCQISNRGYPSPARKELGFGLRISTNN